MFSMLLIIIGIALVLWAGIASWRDTRDMSIAVCVIIIACLGTMVMVFIGGYVIPSQNFDNLEKNVTIEEEYPLTSYKDGSYLRVADIGYSTYHYSMNTVNYDTNATTTKTLNSTDYFVLHYVDNPKDAKFIQTKAVAAHPILKLFCLNYERNIDIYIPPHTISVEDNSYVEP